MKPIMQALPYFDMMATGVMQLDFYVIPLVYFQMQVTGVSAERVHGSCSKFGIMTVPSENTTRQHHRQL